MKTNQDKITKAWFFASRVHKEQKYPGEQLPYVTHIGNVMLEVMGVASTLENAELAICCAILHDTIEDTEVTYDDIEKEFGEAVANGVMALTKNETLGTKREQMIDSLERIKKQPKEVWVVKMADRVANLGEPPHYWKPEKREVYRDEAQIIWNYLHEGDEAMAERLNEKIKKYERYLKC
jgi:(p)ppGpp synthase/HD superfamily hydrolase